MWVARRATSGASDDRVAVGGRLRRPAHPAEAAYDEVFLPLHGAHQADNAAIALAAAEAFFGRPLDRRGRPGGAGRGRLPGRFEVSAVIRWS